MVSEQKVTKFVIDSSGERYIKLSETGINPLILLTMDYTGTTFEGDKTVYVGVKECIRLFEKLKEEFSDKEELVIAADKNISYLNKIMNSNG